MISKLLRIAAWVSLSLMVFVTLAPIGARPQVADVHSEHLAAFAVVGLLFGLAYPRRMLMAALIVIGSAVLLEALQLLTTDRHGRILDMFEKMMGAAIGLAISRFILPFVRHFGWLK